MNAAVPSYQPEPVRDSTSGKSTPLSEPPASVSPQDEIVCGFGQYEQQYDTLHSIGKGAFGFVKLARRRLDDKEVSFEQYSSLLWVFYFC